MTFILLVIFLFIDCQTGVVANIQWIEPTKPSAPWEFLITTTSRISIDNIFKNTLGEWQAQVHPLVDEEYNKSSSVLNGLLLNFTSRIKELQTSIYMIC